MSVFPPAPSLAAPTQPLAQPLTLHAWHALSALAGLPLRLFLRRRRARGKEDAQRWRERMGEPSRPRPPGPLVWCHAASIGESLSILGLVERLRARVPEVGILVTTGTVTSARLLERRLPEGAFHQFVPLDHGPWIRRFLDHWQPSAALWVESELWPGLLAAVAARRIPVALVNARMSTRSFRRWRHLPGLIGHLLGRFQLVLAQSPEAAGHLRALGAPRVLELGNLKYGAPPPPDDAPAGAALAAALGPRPAWLFASSHPGEEALALEVHRQLATTWPDLLTIILPRHPERGAAIAAELAASGLPLARRATGALPGPETALYLADTLGEPGLFFRRVPIAVLGGSFVPLGGHNPIEPALLGSAVLYGPHMHNFAAVAGELEAAEAAICVSDAAGLARALARLLADPGERRRRSEAGRRVALARAAVVDRVLAALAPMLAEAGVLEPEAAEVAHEDAGILVPPARGRRLAS